MATKMLPRVQGAPLTAQGVRDLDQLPRRDWRDPMPVNVGPDERALSAVSGGALVALGLARGGCLGLGLIWTGTALMLRGVTGHCPVSAVTGQNTT
jgi:uncharacterized membrane protein